MLYTCAPGPPDCACISLPLLHAGERVQGVAIPGYGRLDGLKGVGAQRSM